MNHKSETAKSLFTEGYNCAQAVAGAFSDDFGLDRDTMMKMMLPLGGGVGRQREVCGAVLGMCVVLGLKEDNPFPDHEIKRECYEKVRMLCDVFKEKNGSIICRELLGVSESGGDPEKRTAEYYKKRPCIELVACAAQILEEYLSE